MRLIFVAFSGLKPGAAHKSAPSGDGIPATCSRSAWPSSCLRPLRGRHPSPACTVPDAARRDVIVQNPGVHPGASLSGGRMCPGRTHYDTARCVASGTLLMFVAFSGLKPGASHESAPSGDGIPAPCLPPAPTSPRVRALSHASAVWVFGRRLEVSRVITNINTQNASR